MFIEFNFVLSFETEQLKEGNIFCYVDDIKTIANWKREVADFATAAEFVLKCSQCSRL